MRTARVFVAGLLLLAAACTRSAVSRTGGEASRAKPTAIFRTVHFEDVDVTLGRPLRDKASLGAVLGDTAVQLAKGRFGGAEAIMVALASGDSVRGMTYDYGVDTTFEARVADYVNALGPPTVRWRLGRPDAPLGEVVEWDDSLTHFELRWSRRNGAAVAQSELLDRHLAHR